MNDYFASISTINDENTKLPPFTKHTDNSLSQIICTEREFQKEKKTIEVLNPNKASGDDSISHKILRCVSKSVSKPLCILMNRSFEEGIFPDIWKIAIVNPIFKKGDKSQPSNYRPVALLSCIGKLQKRIVFKNMYNFLLDNNLLYKYQSGFLPHHSPVFQLIDIFHNICQAYDNNMFSCIVFCDVSKHLIESGIRIFYLSYGRMALKGRVVKQLFKSKKAESWSQVLHLRSKIYHCRAATGVCSWTSFISGIHK